jgi:hypothetical protein
MCASEGNSTLERVMRIELTYRAWEASVLPLNYTRLSVLPGVAAKGF